MLCLGSQLGFDVVQLRTVLGSPNQSLSIRILLVEFILGLPHNNKISHLLGFGMVGLENMSGNGLRNDNNSWIRLSGWLMVLGQMGSFWLVKG